MKSILAILLLSILAPQSGTYRLTVNVNNIRPVKGELYVALHARPEYFYEPDSAMMKEKVKIDTESETVVFRNVPAGTYAVAVYQDENMNGTLDMNPKGMPKEPYAFSGKSRGPGKPKFEEAAFELTGNDTIYLKLVHLPVLPPKTKDSE